MTFSFISSKLTFLIKLIIQTHFGGRKLGFNINRKAKLKVIIEMHSLFLETETALVVYDFTYFEIN